jgi:molybdopterin converting factor small subunit
VIVATVLIPRALRRCTEDAGSYAGGGATVRAVFAEVTARYPSLAPVVCEDDGRWKPFVAVFLNGSNVTSRAPSDVPCADGDEIQIVMAIAGG